MSTSGHRLSKEALRQLPIFPLPESVLFPGTAQSLYVFEPRYRDLVAHCLERGGVLAIALLEPGYEADYENRPPIYPVMGAGQIVAHERLPDGCSNILVEGWERVRCREELTSEHRFRVISAERLVETVDGRTAAAAETLRSLLLHLAEANPEARAAIVRLVATSRSPGQLADRVAASMLAEVDVRRRVLEELIVTDRLERVTSELAQGYLQGAGPGEGDLAS